jgi:uncharacterized membrane protein
MRGRLRAIDWMRGLVMILMTLDHASATVNRLRYATDGYFLYRWGQVLPPAQFYTRWITHLCAPTFLFLAGMSLSLSTARRVQAGEAAWDIDRYLLARGALIAALDPLWMSFKLWHGQLALGVLWAIGASLMCMVALRRVPTRWLLAGSLAFLVADEEILKWVLRLHGGRPWLPSILLLRGGELGRVFVSFPPLSWLPFLTLGWCAGQWVLDRRAATGELPSLERPLLALAALSATVFLFVRGLNGYGNQHLLWRPSVSQWLHVSKYPPSLSFAALELGLMFALLALFTWLERDPHRELRVLSVFGQTAFFFYVIHVHLLKLGAWALGLAEGGELGLTFAFTVGSLLALYPLCVIYSRYKAAHPGGWTRYL